MKLDRYELDPPSPCSRCAVVRGPVERALRALGRGWRAIIWKIFGGI